MYLSEIFLNQVEADASSESVKRGIEKCEQILNEKLLSIPTLIGKSMFFITDIKGKENGHAHEILDFWDVVKEFAEDYQHYDIIKLAQCIRKLYD